MKRIIVIGLIVAAALCGCANGQGGSRNEGNAVPNADSLAAAKAAEDSALVENRVQPAAEISNPPLFNGKGAMEFVKWVGSKISYPKAAADSLQRGIVEVSFVIDKSGNVVDAKVIKSVSYLLDSVALDVVKSSPLWTPGKNEEGKPVQVSYVIPVNFTLN